MTNHTQTNPLSKFGTLLKDHFSHGGEVAAPPEGNRLSAPATGNSGYAVGWVQRDLARAPNDLGKIMEVLKQDSVLAGEADRLKTVLGKKASQFTDADQKFIDSHKNRIDDQLGTREGKQVLEDISAARAKLLEQKVNELAKNAGKLAKGFMDSAEGKLRIADYLNQFGTKTDKLEPFLKGAEVTLNNGNTKIKLNRPLTVEKWRDYVGGTKFGAENPRDVERRFGVIDNTLKRGNLKPEAPRRQDAAPPVEKPAEIPKDTQSGTDTPEIRNFIDFATKPPTGADAVLLKRPERVTEAEMISLIRQPDYDRNKTLGNAVRKWHVSFFGDGPMPRDATGRQINGVPPLRPFPPTATPPAAADGGDLISGIRRVADTVAEAARPNLADGVKRLQRTLNAFALDQSAHEARPLAVDGAFGPATRRRLQQDVATIGAQNIQDAFLDFSF